MVKHPKSSEDIEREKFQKKYGPIWRRYIIERRNYPFGKKSKPLITFTLRNKPKLPQINKKNKKKEENVKKRKKGKNFKKGQRKGDK